MIHDDIFNQDAACFAHQRACKRLLRHLCQNSQVRIIKEDTHRGRNMTFINCRQYIDAFNASCLSWVPEQGTVSFRITMNYLPCTMVQLYLDMQKKLVSYHPITGCNQVGASGDLAPLSHLALGLMGEGQMWSPATGWGDAK